MCHDHRTVVHWRCPQLLADTDDRVWALPSKCLRHFQLGSLPNCNQVPGVMAA